MNHYGTTSVTLCSVVRDEGPYLLEWIAWYKLLGFHQIVVYDNDSRDDSKTVLASLHRAGELIHRLWPDRPGVPRQIPAFRDAIERCGTEWIAFFDVDEFLVLHDAASIVEFLTRFPDDCSAIAVNQRFFGSSGLERYDDRLVIERFTRSAPLDHFLNVWVKTIARTSRIHAINNPHGCQLNSGHYMAPDGTPCTLRGEAQTEMISLSVAQYNHYILKSREEYLQKRAKGRVDVAGEAPERFDKYTDEFFALHDQNVCKDESASQWAERVRIERDRLNRLCAV